jgi:CDP-diacylglycerol pyrophosphatase
MRAHWIWLALLAALCSAAAMADPDALWKIVHEQCVPKQMAGLTPMPCAEVNLDQGYAVLKDRVGAWQYLLIPTAQISGIESPALTQVNAPHYWQQAWRARAYMEQKTGRAIPRNDVALAINSAYGRTQRQLHIHISCVKPAVYQAVNAIKDSLGASWQTIPGALLDHHYQARRLDALPGDLPAEEPFSLISKDMASSPDEMGHYSLAMLALTFSDGTPGFVLLLDHTDPKNGDMAAAEELQDHSCAILQQP